MTVFAYAGTVAERGGLEVICGPMFSGKTDALIARFESARVAGREVTALKPARDGRHSPDRV
ncbi:MAG: Thymidine kinase, partial [Gaiellaceae bacterium]|nr:Thymidine kinase [Gaiellaceae bacterium]